jgi:hypothetical protein
VLGNLAVLLAAVGVFGTGTGWPDVVVAAIMASLALQGARVVLNQSLAELRKTTVSRKQRKRARFGGRPSNADAACRPRQGSSPFFLVDPGRAFYGRGLTTQRESGYRVGMPPLGDGTIVLAKRRDGLRTATLGPFLLRELDSQFPAPLLNRLHVS